MNSGVMPLVNSGLMPLAGLGITSISDAVGMQTAMLIAAVVYGTIGLFVLARVRRECGGFGETCVEDAESPPPPVAATV